MFFFAVSTCPHCKRRDPDAEEEEMQCCGAHVVLKAGKTMPR